MKEPTPAAKENAKTTAPKGTIRKVFWEIHGMARNRYDNAIGI
jgi:hypothetical protein